MLSDIQITNYRTFESLKVPFSPQVNLIVGTNNSGKSSLLEAIYLLTSEDPTSSLLHLLNERGEYSSRTSDMKFERRPAGGYQISSIFHGRSLKSGQSLIIKSNSKSNVSLAISLREAKIRRDTDIAQYSLFGDDELASIDGRAQLLVLEKQEPGKDPKIDTLRVTEGDLVFIPGRPLGRRLASPDQKAKFVTTNFMGYDELAALWDTITLTPQEEKVVDALRILDPDVDRLSFTSRQTSNSGVLLKLHNEKNPVSLGSMGDGMRRALAIAAALVSVENGTLLVDEIDTGLYYGVLAGIWRLILETASRRGVQVFATTHSWDCVKAFQYALNKYTGENVGQLVRIDKIKSGLVKPTVYTADELEIAIQQDIEVR